MDITHSGIFRPYLVSKTLRFKIENKIQYKDIRCDLCISKVKKFPSDKINLH